MVEVPSYLTQIPKKQEVYVGDPFFREAWEDFSEFFKDAERIRAAAWRYGVAVFRPDTISVRGAGKAVKYLKARNFMPVAVESLLFDRVLIREAWRYQLNVATRERINVMDMILTLCPSVYVVFADSSPQPSVPATARLRHYKGSSHPTDRHAHHMRSFIGQPLATVLSYVHVADEPADLIREMGLFFPWHKRQELFNAMAAMRDVTADVLSLINELEARLPEHSLDANEVLSRVEFEVRRLEAEGQHSRELGTWLGATRLLETQGWAAFICFIQGLGVQLTKQDEIAIAASNCSNFQGGEDYTDAEVVIPDSKGLSWPNNG